MKRKMGLQYELQLIKKEQKEPYWPRLIKEKRKLHNLSVDWNLYCDSDEEGEQKKEDDEDWDKYEGKLK